MSSYFSEVSLGKELADSFTHRRAEKLVGVATYIGVAPEVTTVLYAPGDRLGLAAAMASLIPIGLCVALLTVFLSRRTAEDLWVGGGQLACEVVNGVLKLLIKQPRPSSPVTNMPVDSYGMPSAHSQYMGYFAAIIILQTLKASKISYEHRVVRIVTVLVLSMFTAYSRYYLYYHTGPQVVIGYLVGMLFGLIWFNGLALLRYLGILQWGLSLWPCRLLLVKDTESSVLDEYENYKYSTAHEKKQD